MKSQSSKSLPGAYGSAFRLSYPLGAVSTPTVPSFSRLQRVPTLLRSSQCLMTVDALQFKLTSQHLDFLSRCHGHSISQYRNTRNRSISQFQEYLLRYHASVEDDTKRVQSALCTRMRIVFSSIRLGPKTSVCREVCHCHVYCIRL